MSAKLITLFVVLGSVLGTVAQQSEIGKINTVVSRQLLNFGKSLNASHQQSTSTPPPSLVLQDE
jgi:hypothetical protein